MYNDVKIGREIPGEELARILIEAAEEVGLNVTSTDNYRTEYKLGSVSEERVYTNTRIRLKGRILPIAELIIHKDSKFDWFSIGTGTNTTFPHFGFGSKKTIKKYLSAVSERLSAT